MRFCVAAILIVIVLITSSIPHQGTAGANDVNDDKTLADAPWPKTRNNLRNTGLSPYDTSDNTGDLLWKAEEPSGGMELAIGEGDTIYVCSQSGELFAYDMDGDLVWSEKIGYHMEAEPAICGDGTIYTSVWYSMQAVSPSGEVLWKFGTENYIYSSPTIDEDGTMYFGCLDGFFYALNPNGTLKWKFETQTFVYEGIGPEGPYNVTSIEGISSSPAIDEDGTIYFSGGDSRFYALNPDGSLKWKRYDPCRFSSPVIGDDGTIYVGGSNHSYRNDDDIETSWATNHYTSFLLAMDSEGKDLWKYEVPGVMLSSPAIGPDGTLYAGGGDNYLYAFDKNGDVLWQFRMGGGAGSPVVGADGTIFVCCEDDYVYAIHPNGTMKWEFRVGRINSNMAIGSDGTLYATGSGTLYAIGNADRQGSDDDDNSDVPGFGTGLLLAAILLIAYSAPGQRTGRGRRPRAVKH